MRNGAGCPGALLGDGEADGTSGRTAKAEPALLSRHCCVTQGIRSQICLSNSFCSFYSSHLDESFVSQRDFFWESASLLFLREVFQCCLYVLLLKFWSSPGRAEHKVFLVFSRVRIGLPEDAQVLCLEKYLSKSCSWLVVFLNLFSLYGFFIMSKSRISISLAVLRVASL